MPNPLTFLFYFGKCCFPIRQFIIETCYIQPNRLPYYHCSSGLWDTTFQCPALLQEKQTFLEKGSQASQNIKLSYRCSRNSITFIGTTYADVYSVQGTTFFRTYTLRWYLFKKLADNSSMAVLHLQHCTNKLTTIKQNIRNRITLFIISSGGRLIIIIII